MNRLSVHSTQTHTHLPVLASSNITVNHSWHFDGVNLSTKVFRMLDRIWNCWNVKCAIINCSLSKRSSEDQSSCSWTFSIFSTHFSLKVSVSQSAIREEIKREKTAFYMFLFYVVSIFFAEYPHIWKIHDLAFCWALDTWARVRKHFLMPNGFS